MSVNDKILNHLRSNLPFSFNAKTIFREFKGEVSENTIRQSLKRLTNKGALVREDRGFYRAKISPETMHIVEKPPTMLHGIVLKCKSQRLVQNWGQGTPQRWYTGEECSWFHSNGYLDVDKNKSHMNNNSWYKSIWHLDRRINIVIHLNGSIVLSINSSKHPLSYPEFVKLLDYIEGVLNYWSPFSDFKLEEIGIGKDFKKLRLEGVNCIGLKVFTNAWSKVYYKDDINSTRFEYHISTNISLEEAMETLKLLNNPSRNGFTKSDSNDEVVDGVMFG